MDLIRHKQSIHDGLKFKCARCEKVFSEKRGLAFHKQTVHGQRKYCCGSCNHQATTKAGLSIHINNLHEGIRFPCTNCDYQATQKGDLSRHYKSVHEKVKTYECDFCKYATSRSDQLKSHSWKKHGGGKYQKKEETNEDNMGQTN